MRISTLHLLVERLLVSAQRRSTMVFVAAAAAALVGGLLVLRISFDADVLRLLPRDAPTVRSFEQFLRDFGSLDHLYVVFESPDAVGEHSDLVNAYVDALRAAPEIESVDAALFESGKDWTYLYDRELYLLGEHGAAEALERLSGPGLDRAMVHARELLSMPSSDIKTMVQQDPLGMLTLLRDRFAKQQGFVAFDPTQEGYVSADGRSRLVMVKPTGAPFDSDFCKALFRRLDDIERRLRASSDEADQRVTIQTAGAYRISLEAESLIRRESIVNSVGSLVLLLVIVMAVFRTPWMMVYGILPLALAAVLALGLAGMTVGRLSPATSGAAAILFGLGIDGIVILYMRYLEARETGAAPADACRGMAGAAVGVILAQLTTAATFFALLFIDFPTLNDLGLLVGTGMLITCVFTLVMVPALLARDARMRGRALAARWLGRFVDQRSRAIIWTAVITTVVLGAAATRLRVDMSLERLQAHTAGADLERDIATRFSLPTDVWLALNEGPSLDALVAVDARLAEHFAAHVPTVSVSGVSLVLPPAARQQAIASQIRGASASTRDISNSVRASAERAGFRPAVFDLFLSRLPRLLDADTRVTHEGLLSHGLAPIVSRFVAHRSGRYSVVTYLYPQPPADSTALEAAVQAVDPALRLSGLPAIDRELGRRFPKEFLKGLLIGTAAVALIIYIVFRSLRDTLLALVPTAVGFVWSAGLLALARVHIDLFSMFAAVTCVGISVDYGLYVLTRSIGRPSGDVRDVVERTGAAIIVACGTALVGFGTLITSSYGPLRAFGTVSVATLTCCLVSSLLLLPAILIETRR
jgi:predicted exporter